MEGHIRGGFKSMSDEYKARINEAHRRDWQHYLEDQRNPFALREKEKRAATEKVKAKEPEDLSILKKFLPPEAFIRHIFKR